MSARLSVLALVALSACAPTDTGNPPAALHANLVSSTATANLVGVSFSIYGAPGAVEPAEGEVWLLALDEARPLERVPVRSDGSFSREMIGARDGARVRLWVETSRGRSDPLDRRVTPDGLAELVDALPACVETEPRFALDFGRVPIRETARDAVVVVNRCDEAITLTVPTTLEPSLPFAVTGTSGTLAPGESTSIEVSWVSTGEGPVVDSFDVMTAPPMTTRRAVTLIANAR